MKGVDFFSDNKYILLPTSSNPKVALALGSKNVTRNSFRLYTPFSAKAKVLKTIAWYSLKFTSYFPTIKKTGKSDFISYLEARLKKPLIASVYYATDKNKIVIQLQSEEAEILGYLKMSVSPLGKKRLENEKRAIEVLSTVGLSSISILDSGAYEGNTYILYKEISGIPACPEEKELTALLAALKKENRYALNKHPRILQLCKDLEEQNQTELVKILLSVCNKTEGLFHEVYEHGDFAPWNIMKKPEGGYELFDFEYFGTEGLEYLDLIKYYYQVGSLLQHKKGNALVQYILNSISHPFAKELLIIFLIKEINILILEGKNFNEEKDLIHQLIS